MPKNFPGTTTHHIVQYYDVERTRDPDYGHCDHGTRERELKNQESGSDWDLEESGFGATGTAHLIRTGKLSGITVKDEDLSSAMAILQSKENVSDPPELKHRSLKTRQEVIMDKNVNWVNTNASFHIKTWKWNIILSFVWAISAQKLKKLCIEGRSH